MTGPTDKELISTVNIIPDEKYPFKILEAKPNKEGNIRLELKEVKKEKGVEYLLTVVNLKTVRSRYYDKIILKTDSMIRPELNISVYGNIFEQKKQVKAN